MPPLSAWAARTLNYSLGISRSADVQPGCGTITPGQTVTISTTTSGASIVTPRSIQRRCTVYSAPITSEHDDRESDCL